MKISLIYTKSTNTESPHWYSEKEYQFRLRFLKGVGQWLVVEFPHTYP